MALKIQIPATPLNLFKTGLVKKYEAEWYPWAVRSIWKHYNAIFREVEAMHNVPAEVMCTLVSIELPDSSEPKLRARMERIVTGNPRTGAVGMCQIDLNTADNALRNEYNSGNLSDEEIAYFRGKLGGRFDQILKGGRLVHTVKDLSNPSYNIHVGAVRFGQLMRNSTGPDGVVRIDRAIIPYNGSSAPLPPIGSSVAAVIASQKGMNKARDRNTTYKYILRFIGTNGGMDILTRSRLT